MKRILIIFLCIISFSSAIYAHKGRTDSYGGHYNRSEGTYHYHSGQYAGTGEYTKPVEEGGTKITEDTDTGVSSGLIVNTDSTSTEIDNLNTKIKTLEQEIQAKQSTIGELNSKIDKKNKEINELNDKTIEYIVLGMSILITAIIAYNVGKNKK